VNIATGKKAEHTPELPEDFAHLKVEGIEPGLSLKEPAVPLS